LLLIFSKYKSKSKELNMFTRAPQFTDEWGVSKFYCYRDKQLVGFIFFDPLFKDGECIGYSIGSLCQIPEIEYSRVFNQAILNAVKTFLAEGYEILSLWFSPKTASGNIPKSGRRSAVCSAVCMRTATTYSISVNPSFASPAVTAAMAQRAIEYSSL
jgi:hypothetical protein